MIYTIIQQVFASLVFVLYGILIEMSMYFGNLFKDSIESDHCDDAKVSNLDGF